MTGELRSRWRTSEFEELRRLAKERGSSYSQLIGKANDVPSQGWTNHPSGGYVGEGMLSIESRSGGTKR